MHSSSSQRTSSSSGNSNSGSTSSKHVNNKGGSSSSSNIVLKPSDIHFMEQVYHINRKSGQDPLMAGQKEALCEQLGLSEYDVIQWFSKRAEEDVMKPSNMRTGGRGNSHSSSSSRPKVSYSGVDFLQPLSELQRPLPSVTNTDLDHLSVYCRQLTEQARGVDTPAAYCSQLSPIASRASVYLEDRDYASALGILMVIVEEFAIAREHLDDQFGLVDMFGRLLVRQSAYTVLSTNWNVVEHAEELSKTFANVMCNAHIRFRSFEINRRQHWQKSQALHAKPLPPPKGVQHLDVVAKLARCPWDSKYMQSVLNGRFDDWQGKNSEVLRKVEPAMITDVRLEILSHAKDHDALYQALYFSRFHLNSFLGNNQVEDTEMADESKKSNSSNSKRKNFDIPEEILVELPAEPYEEDPAFEEYLYWKLKHSVVTLYFKVQQWETAAELCKLSFEYNLDGMREILQQLIKASKTFVGAREPALELAKHAVSKERVMDSFYVSSKLTNLCVNFLAEYFPDRFVAEVSRSLDDLRLMSHARFLLEALTPHLKTLVHQKGISDPQVEIIMRLAVDVAIKAWKLDRCECKMPDKDFAKLKEKKDERAVICDWLLECFTMLGSRCHEIGLLAALASFALAPDFKAFMLIKRIHTQSRTGEADGPALEQSQHRELVMLLSRECNDQGLDCLQDPNLNWTKLTQNLIKTKCNTYTKVKICLDERMYDEAIKSVERAISFILPPQFSSHNTKTGKSYAAEAYDALQQMLADRNFVTENPQFCYDSAHTLVHNIIRVGSGHGKPNERPSKSSSSSRDNAGELAYEHFHLLYDAVRVMCFVVNSVNHSRRLYGANPHNPQAQHLANVTISVMKLYEDLDGLKDLPGLPTEHDLLKTLWAGMAEVIQTSLGQQTTQQLLISKHIIPGPDERGAGGGGATGGGGDGGGGGAAQQVQQRYYTVERL